MLTQERLKELFSYDPETGSFTRLVKTGPRGKIGSVAGHKFFDGNKDYIRIGLENKKYLAHRLAFLYMTGIFPKRGVDHEDGIGTHNWWSNLKEANNSQNQQNQKRAMKNNKSTGLLGSYKHGTNFRALITLNGKQKCLGTFKSAEEAHQAYLTAKRELHEFNTL